jgi:hypothetical protein
MAKVAQASRDLIDEFTLWGRGVESDFQSAERRINRHRVDLDNLGERTDLLEGQMASLSVAEDHAAKEVVDLTLESDEEEEVDRAEDLPSLEMAPSASGSGQGGPVSRQLCIRTLGRINKPGPYPVPVEPRRGGSEGVPRRHGLRAISARLDRGGRPMSCLSEGGDEGRGLSTDS